MALLEKDLEIKISTIAGAGKGLFTAVFIPKGTRIVEYKGTVTTWDEVRHDPTNGYIYFVKAAYVIDARDHPKSFARYANDAKGLTRARDKRNNTKFEADGLRVFLVAIKDIGAGEELFVDYGRKYWDTVRKNNEMSNE